jgi:ABC-type multidrug transport system ATPase subunit
MTFRLQIVMDEPTASVDMATDARIQPLIREVFGDMTLLTIAHRINTVISMDRILVLSQGELLEYGIPATLLQDRGGALSGMVDAMGEDTAEELRAAAVAAAAALLEKTHTDTAVGDSVEIAADCKSSAHTEATVAREAGLGQLKP